MLTFKIKVNFLDENIFRINNSNQVKPKKKHVPKVFTQWNPI